MSSAGELIAPSAAETVDRFIIDSRLAASTHSLASPHLGSHILFFLYVDSKTGTTELRFFMAALDGFNCKPLRVIVRPKADKTINSRQNRVQASCSRITAI